MCTTGAAVVVLIAAAFVGDHPVHNLLAEPAGGAQEAFGFVVALSATLCANVVLATVFGGVSNVDVAQSIHATRLTDIPETHVPRMPVSATPVTNSQLVAVWGSVRQVRTMTFAVTVLTLDHGRHGRGFHRLFLVASKLLDALAVVVVVDRSPGRNDPCAKLAGN